MTDSTVMDQLTARPRRRRKAVLTRRLWRQRSSVHPFWHPRLGTPTLTPEQAEQIKAQFLKASRAGIVVTGPNIEIRRVGAKKMTNHGDPAHFKYGVTPCCGLAPYELPPGDRIITREEGAAVEGDLGL